ncbi:MAG: hypothetical protein JWM68_1957 [Verrucomicrobiales bacterium]|nr:hypothetical protein [Verrucomicrobiales bacterium]
MKRILLIVGSLLILGVVAIIIAFMTLTQPKLRPNVTVKFLAFTNDATGTRMATFNLSNASPWAISRGGSYSVQLPVSNGWRTTNRGWFQGSIVPAGSSEVVLVTAPTNQNRWRVSFTTSKQNAALTEMTSELMYQLEKLTRPKRSRFRRVGYVTTSDPIQE